MNEKYKILFVCLGNICRSPAAEAVFRDRVEKPGSPGGRDRLGGADRLPCRRRSRPANEGACRAAGLPPRFDLRPVAPEDDRFDRIVGMDDRNLRELRRLGRKTESGAAICK
ncbi:MAG: hypothetical protein ACLR76_00710 [Alistipes sp.]